MLKIKVSSTHHPPDALLRASIEGMSEAKVEKIKVKNFFPFAA
jgi:hypothetical protein